MKFPDVILACSIAFAAGMVVPFAFFQLNSSTSRASIDVNGEYANAKPLEKAFLPTQSPVVNAAQPEPTEAIYGIQIPQVPTPVGLAANETRAVGHKIADRQSSLTKLGDISSAAASVGSMDDKSLTIAEPERGEIASALESKLIADVQTELLIRGYNTGVVDGKLGGRTVSAIKSLQRDNELNETGSIDAPVLEALNITLAAKKPVFESKLNPSKSRNVATSNSDPITTTAEHEVSTQSSGQPINLLTFGKNKIQSD